ncbi:hypothetical protein EVAR_98296_1 [Eumeta japonica]|uniref:Uncharacterized protein n=1 Tax=Eumeta variegata TaxID=151549 RepID=A0A4C1XBD7_EUMVA|nr:hypothetical protein EVAR_98296_1 [Eumeta japonica]
MSKVSTARHHYALALMCGSRLPSIISSEKSVYLLFFSRVVAEGRRGPDLASLRPRSRHARAPPSVTSRSNVLAKSRRRRSNAELNNCHLKLICCRRVVDESSRARVEIAREMLKTIRRTARPRPRRRLPRLRWRS